MLKRVSLFLSITVALTALLLPSLAVAQASASKTAVCNGAGMTVDGNGNCAPNLGDPTVNSVTVTAINVFSIVIGLIAVIMMMLGGLKYIMSQGDANQIASAKNTLLYAVAGVAIAAMAQIIVKFVLNKIG